MTLDVDVFIWNQKMKVFVLVLALDLFEKLYIVYTFIFDFYNQGIFTLPLTALN